MSRPPRRRLLALLGGAAAAACLPVRRAAEARVFPESGEVVFTAVYQGREIGTRRQRFSRRGPDFVVESAVTIGALGGRSSAGHFRHNAEEVWRNGWLDEVIADTRIEGQRFNLRARRSAGALRGRVNGRGFSVSGYVIPNSLWHRDTPFSRGLFDLVDGRFKLVDSHYLGRDEVMVTGLPRPARHYRLHGGMERELWYDADFALVQVAMPVAGGGSVRLERR